MNIDHTILTVITFAPLAGAVLLALLPDKGKIMQWGALAITLLTFLLTLVAAAPLALLLLATTVLVLPCLCARSLPQHRVGLGRAFVRALCCLFQTDRFPKRIGRRIDMLDHQLLDAAARTVLQNALPRCRG